MSADIPDLSITDLWGHYSGLIGRNQDSGWISAYCILHEDVTSSARLNEDAGKWHCFTCDKRGDAIELIKEVEGVGFLDALAIAKRIAGEGNVSVSVPDEPHHSSTLLPGVKRNKRGRRRFVPAWTGRRPHARA